MSDTTNDRISRVREALTALFAPSHLEVIDESARHSGHLTRQSGEQTHIAITLRSSSFTGLSRIDIHRRINAVLASEFADGLHAVRIDASA